MDGELKKIKKLYGEDFAKYCRSAFPRLLEQEGLLLETLQSSFPPSRMIYKALVEEDGCLMNAQKVWRISFPKLEKAGVFFLASSDNITSANVPSISDLPPNLKTLIQNQPQQPE